MPEVHIFPITPIDRFARAGGAIKRPTELTHFSYISNADRPTNAPSPTNIRDRGEPSNGHSMHLGDSGTAPPSHSQVRNIYHDSRGLKYYYTPEIGVSLSESYDTFQQLNDGEDEHLDGLLSSITHLEQERRKRRRFDSDVEKAANGSVEDTVMKDDNTQESEQEWKLQPDFITWRGMITKIMSTPYSDFDGFEMNATLFDGTIYIEESHEAKLSIRAQQESQKPRPGQASQEMMSFWGHKFETLSLLPSPWDATSRDFIETRPQHTVNNHDQYVSVVQTGIGDISMILGGEVDAVWDFLPESPTTNPPAYVELKTASASLIHPSTPPDRFDRKLLKFWVQSFLLAIPKIIVGFRTNDPEGRLLSVEEYATTAIPRLVKERAVASGRRPTWEREVCVNFAGELLAFIRDIIKADIAKVDERPGWEKAPDSQQQDRGNGNGRKEGGTYKIRRWQRSNVVEVFKVEEAGFGDILSREFVAWRRTGDEVAAAKEGALERLRGSVWG